MVTHLSINRGLGCSTSVIWPLTLTAFILASCLYCALLRHLSWYSPILEMANIWEGKAVRMNGITEVRHQCTISFQFGRNIGKICQLNRNLEKLRVSTRLKRPKPSPANLLHHMKLYHTFVRLFSWHLLGKFLFRLETAMYCSDCKHHVLLIHLDTNLIKLKIYRRYLKENTFQYPTVVQSTYLWASERF